LLEYTAALFGIPAEQAKIRARELLSLVGLDSERANRQLRKYSKGMLQRIGIAQALVNDPEIVFMDEPMSGLDPIGRREVRDLLLALRSQGKTVFFSSHILSDVEAMCDRAAILSRGKLLRCGTVHELTGINTAIEVVALGIEQSDLGKFTQMVSSLQSASATPNGIHLVLADDKEIDHTLALIRECGGKLISVNPRRASLEDIFADTEQVT
jgi:ABC-2 type transport system ATP-binding protein